ncbi:hypothetical protein L596_022237 [Steinernema carpocapsae]|uniref:ETS domain-containing protein n=1 Tax=Steinernema carpocapsae TaxID=34508 RepID=A0A4U5MLI1_STECR|nr:hypothetical protein L596_022237 [Steinernema carpocapsae]
MPNDNTENVHPKKFKKNGFRSSSSTSHKGETYLNCSMFKVNLGSTILHEFILEQLSDSRSHIIFWTDRRTYEFKVSKDYKKSLAQLWGERKGNPKMTFDSLRRSLRNEKNMFKPRGDGGKVKRLTWRFYPNVIASKYLSSLNVFVSPEQGM